MRRINRSRERKNEKRENAVYSFQESIRRLEKRIKEVIEHKTIPEKESVFDNKEYRQSLVENITKHINTLKMHLHNTQLKIN